MKRLKSIICCFLLLQSIFIHAQNVGIATTSPLSKLDVRGGAFIQADGVAVNDGLTVKSHHSIPHQGGLYLTNSSGWLSGISGVEAFKMSTIQTGAGNAILQMGWVDAGSPNLFNNIRSLIFFKDGNFSIGTTDYDPSTRFRIRGNGDNSLFMRLEDNVISDGMNNKTIAISMQNFAYNGWTIYAGGPDGYYGVAPKAFEIWEYPVLPGWNSECCRRRFIIESTYNMVTAGGPTNLILQSNGNVCSASGSFVTCSDMRYKENIQPLENPLKKLLQLNGVSYNWNVEQFPNRFTNENTQIGLIAQEVEKIYPELVSTDAEGYKAIDYTRLTPVLLEAIKELNNRMMKMENELSLLLQSNSQEKTE